MLTAGEAETPLTGIVEESPTIHSELLFGSHNAVVRWEGLLAAAISGVVRAVAMWSNSREQRDDPREFRCHEQPRPEADVTVGASFLASPSQPPRKPVLSG